MATVAQLKERAASLLPPGSEVQQAFVCQTATNFVIFVINWLTGLTLGLITYRCVAVTSDAIYVLDAHRLSGGATPRSVVATLPRHTGTCRWRSGCWPASCVTIPPGRPPGWPLSWQQRKTGWP